MKLYLKDLRNLVAADMSLDKLGKLFNLPFLFHMNKRPV